MKFRYLKLGIFLIFLIFSINVYSFNLPVRAVQISYIDAKNFNDLKRKLVQIKAHNFNTVIFRVFQNKDDRFYPFIPYRKADAGVYFQTKYAPVVYDLLGILCYICHKLNLKIIAWMETRYCDFGLKFPKIRLVYKFDFKTQKFVPSRGLSFFNEKNFYYILHLYYDLLKYPIDGILIQDDAKILIDEDFNYFARKKFFKKYGLKLTKSNVKKLLYGDANSRRNVKQTVVFEKWQKLKSDQLRRFLDFLSFYCKTKKNIKILMNINYEALNRPDLSLKWYSYNLNTLKFLNIDYFSVMLYQEQIKKELGLNNKNLLPFIKNILDTSKNFNQSKFIFKIQTFNWFTHKMIPVYNIFKLLTFLKENNIKNIAVFPYNKKMFEF